MSNILFILTEDIEGYRMRAYKSNEDIKELGIIDMIIILRNYQDKWLER
jgi:hypothetical protein